MKKIVHIEAVKLALHVLADFNALDLTQVELYENEKLLPITPEILDDFRFCGLSNRDFVERRWWQEGGPDGIARLMFKKRDPSPDSEAPKDNAPDAPDGPRIGPAQR